MTPAEQLRELGARTNWRRIPIISRPGVWVFAVPFGRRGYESFIKAHDEYWVKRAVAIAAKRSRET